MIQNMDLNITNFVITHFQNAFLNPIMIFITKLDNAGFIWILTSIILMFKKKYRTIGFLTLLAVASDYLIGGLIIKNIIQRPRPFVTVSNIHLLINAPMGFSFPSGHAGSSFAAATMLGLYFKKERILFYVFAFLIAFSRVYLGVHYFTDVLCGAILGISLALLVNFIYKKYFFKNLAS